jgi:hypothetical protein
MSNIWHATVFSASVWLSAIIVACHIDTPHVIDKNICQTLPKNPLNDFFGYKPNKPLNGQMGYSFATFSAV